MIRKSSFLFAIFLGALASFSLTNEHNVYIAAKEIISQNYVWAGDSLDFNGHALKDLVLFGKDIVVRGTVDGDVIVFAQRLRVEGDIKGNLRAVGETIDVSGKIGKNASVAGKYINLLKEAEIGWDLISGAQRLYLEGRIKGDVKGWAGEAILGADVGGNVKLRVQELTVLPTSHLKGNLIYYASREAVIPREARIEGKVIYMPLPSAPSKPKGIPFGLKFAWLLSLIATGAVLVLLFPRHLTEIGSDMLGRPWWNIGWGFLFLIATPIGALIIAISLVGIPICFVTLLLYFVALYLTTPIVGTVLGMKILGGLLKVENVNLYAAMALGIAIFFLLKHIPLIGFLISFLGICWGLGGLQGAIRRRIRAG